MEKVTKNIFLTGHVTEIAGPGYYLRDFLVSLPNCKNVVIFHPMPGSDIPESIITHYSPDPKLIKRYPKPSGFLSQMLNDTWITLKHLWLFEGKIDVYVGLNNFDTLPALLFKGWKVRQVVYYGSDYADKRFENPILDKIYRWVEVFVLNGCDLSVSNTNRAMHRRIKLGLDKNKAMVIPNGVDLGLIPKVKKSNKYMFLYQGYLSKTHGIIETIDSIKKLSRRFPEINLAVAGKGPDEEEIKKYAYGLDIDKKVAFMGNMPGNKLYHFMAKDCLIGIASYTLGASWVKYGSPLKVKDYLGCGMAVIMSDITEVAEDVEKYKLGIVYDDYQGLYRAIEKFCKEPESLHQYVHNAKKYIKAYNWKDMFASKLQPRLSL